MAPRGTFSWKPCEWEGVREDGVLEAALRDRDSLSSMDCTNPVNFNRVKHCFGHLVHIC